ncbi:hypothetical protein CPB83DRAFT_899311 [Crepidotus variabilis]|uniref:Uncharacterized protein n=1 Tax=Crepidotus variabilis TaxID=179855 RepID=A0A9P6E5E3_9AGAR|nr:hypothetical protein CPB83DRAFT_899311 [Crepidotus variabilis]
MRSHVRSKHNEGRDVGIMRHQDSEESPDVVLASTDLGTGELPDQSSLLMQTPSGLELPAPEPLQKENVAPAAANVGLFASTFLGGTTPAVEFTPDQHLRLFGNMNNVLQDATNTTLAALRNQAGGLSTSALDSSPASHPTSGPNEIDTEPPGPQAFCSPAVPCTPVSTSPIHTLSPLFTPSPTQATHPPASPNLPIHTPVRAPPVLALSRDSLPSIEPLMVMSPQPVSAVLSSVSTSAAAGQAPVQAAINHTKGSGSSTTEKRVVCKPSTKKKPFEASASTCSDCGKFKGTWYWHQKRYHQQKRRMEIGGHKIFMYRQGERGFLCIFCKEKWHPDPDAIGTHCLSCYNHKTRAEGIVFDLARMAETTAPKPSSRATRQTRARTTQKARQVMDYVSVPRCKTVAPLRHSQLDLSSVPQKPLLPPNMPGNHSNAQWEEPPLLEDYHPDLDDLTDEEDLDLDNDSIIQAAAGPRATQDPISSSGQQRLPIAAVNRDESVDEDEQEDDGAGQTVDERAPGPEVATLLARLYLTIVRVTAVKDGPVPRFLACQRCKKGVDPGSAVQHATANSRDGCRTQLDPTSKFPNPNISLAQKKIVRDWINGEATDLHSSQNLPPVPKNSWQLEPLELLGGFACDTCGYVSTKDHMIRRHATEDRHPSWSSVTCHALFYNCGYCVVRKRRPDANRRPPDATATLVQEYLDEYSDPSKNNPRSVLVDVPSQEMPLLIQIQRWHEPIWQAIKETAGDPPPWTSGDDNNDDNSSGGQRSTALEEARQADRSVRRKRNRAVVETDEESEEEREKDATRRVNISGKRRRGNIQMAGRVLGLEINVSRQAQENKDSDNEENEDGMDVDAVEDDEDDGDNDVIPEDLPDDRLFDEELDLINRATQDDHKVWTECGTLVSLVKIQALRSLLEPVASKEQQEAWTGNRLMACVKSYMRHVSIHANNADVSIRRILGNIPTGTGSTWIPKLKAGTVNKYATLLCQLIRAIAITEEDPEDWAHYHFHLTPEDKRNLLSLKTKLEDPETQSALNELHTFLKPIVYPRPSSRESRWKDPLERFYALCTLKGDGTFHEAKDLTGLFAKMEYHMRSVMFYQGRAMMLASPSMTLLEAVSIQVKVNIGKDFESPFNACFNHHILLKALAARSTGAPTVRVSDDGLQVFFKEITFEIPRFRNGLQGLFKQAEQDLNALLYNKDYGLSDLWKPPFKDDWANVARGYSGLKRNAELDCDNEFLEDVFREITPFSKTSDGLFVANIPAIDAWMSRVAAVTKNLALLAFFTAGQPARSTEFIETKIQNANRPRGLMIDHKGEVWLMTRRAKWESIAKREVFIPKKLPPHVSELLLKWLIILRPVEAMLSRHLQLTEREAEKAVYAYQTYLWTLHGKPMESEDFNKVIKAFLDDCGCLGGTIASYRHVAVEMWRLFIPPAYDGALREEQSRMSSDQRGHSLNRARETYALEMNHLPGLSSDLLRKYAKISELWWRVIGFVPGREPLQPYEAAIERKEEEMEEMKKQVGSTVQKVQEINEKVDKILVYLKEGRKLTRAIDVKQTESNNTLKSCSEDVATLANLLKQTHLS